MMGIIKKIACLLLALVWNQLAMGQFDYTHIAADKQHVNYTEGTDKLASNVCYKLEIDNEGYLWVATDRGLQVYNGSVFESIEIPGYDGEIVCLFKDGAYLIGMSYYGDIVYIHTRTRKIELLRNYHPPWNQPNNMFKNFFRVGDELYFLRYFGQSFIMNASDFYTRSIDKFRNIRLFAHRKEFHSIMIDAIRKKYDIQSPLVMSLMPELIDIELQKISFYEDGFSSGNKYLYRSDKQNPEDSWLYYRNEHVRKGDYILGVLDLGSERWIAWRYYGLEILKKEAGADRYTPAAHYLNGICVSGLIKDGQGSIWLSTLSNGLLRISDTDPRDYYNACTDKHLYFDEDIHFLHVLPDRIITGYRKPVADVSWGQNGKGLKTARYIADTVTDNSETRNMLVNAAGKSILVSGEGNLYEFAGPSASGKLKAIVVKDMYEELSDYIAVVKRTFFLKINKDTLNLDTVRVNSAGISSYNLILAKCSAFPDSGSYIANSSGLFLNNRHIVYGADFRVLKLRNYQGNIVLLNSQQIWIKQPGLPDFELLGGIAGNEVRQIEWDQLAGDMYILTGKGITRYNIRSGKSSLFLSNEEIPLETKINCFYLDTASLWVGMSRGIIRVDKDKLDHKLTFPLYIRPSYRKNSSPLSDTLNYTYSSKLDIPLVVDILDYHTAKYNIVYKIYDQDRRLFKEGIADKDHILNIGLFRPGTYYINVSAFQLKGYINREIVLVIDPLWWQRISVQLGGVLLAIALVITLTAITLKRRNRRLYANLEQQHELLLVKNKLQSSRLKPHFIFNALNPLQKYILEDNKEDALQYFEQFSKLMRNSIKNFEVDFTTLEEELIFLKQYIFVQECRYPGKFELITDFHLQRKTTEIKLPAMILQPIFENAIEHGFSEEKNKINIIGFSIVEQTAENTLTIIIENSGSRFAQPVRPNEDRGLGIVARKVSLIATQFGAGSIIFGNGEMGAQCKIILPLDVDRRLKR